MQESPGRLPQEVDQSPLADTTNEEFLTADNTLTSPIVPSATSPAEEDEESGVVPAARFERDIAVTGLGITPEIESLEAHGESISDVQPNGIFMLKVTRSPR